MEVRPQDLGFEANVSADLSFPSLNFLPSANKEYREILLTW